MIPKIIHLCWLSGDPYPRKIQDCLDSWKKHLPSYEIILWDTKRFNIHEVPWVEQAFNTKLEINPAHWSVKLGKASGRTAEAVHINSMLESIHSTVPQQD